MGYMEPKGVPQSPLDKELFPSTRRKVWIKLFLKYNTPMPSSDAVERLFSTA